MTSFSSLHLAEPLDRALRDLEHTAPTPIQRQAIPKALEGRDIMGIAQTGTGKTAAFTLPTLHHIFTEEKDAPKRGARVLILAPTRELADQIAVSVRNYGRHMVDLTVSCIFGGVPINRQIKRLVHGNDVIVATPGRLIDLLERKAIRLNEIEILILDEADQMMDMGFIHALKKIIPALPKKRQTLFFSATLAPAIKKLSQQFLNDPVHISVTPPNTTAEKVEQRVYLVGQAEKQDLLSVTLLDEAVKRALVFTRTKHGADRVVKRLAKVGILAVAIHGNKSQGQRQRALEAYRSGKVNILIATDIAARGIDIPDISHVINFEIPNVPEQYVHRIGRTARAERSGVAISFIDKSEEKYLRDIEKLLKDRLPRMDRPSDMAEKVKGLQSRKALPPPEKPKPDPRKGRGKSKRKGRFSQSKISRDNKPRQDDGSGSHQGSRHSAQDPQSSRRQSPDKQKERSQEKSKGRSENPSKKTVSRSEDRAEYRERVRNKKPHNDKAGRGRNDRYKKDDFNKGDVKEDRAESRKRGQSRTKPKTKPRFQDTGESAERPIKELSEKAKKAQSYSGKGYRGKPNNKKKNGPKSSANRKPSRANRKANRKP
jgi:ATP-dependent RNA helicase RhlE